MYDATIVSVQLPNGGRFAILFCFLCGFFGEVFKVLPFLGQISADINTDPHPFLTIAVDHFFDKVLDGFKGLASLSNEDSGSAAFDFVGDTFTFTPGYDAGTIGDARRDFFQCFLTDSGRTRKSAGGDTDLTNVCCFKTRPQMVWFSICLISLNNDLYLGLSGTDQPENTG